MVHTLQRRSVLVTNRPVRAMLFAALLLLASTGAAAAPAPAITLSPASGPSGSSVTLFGSGFGRYARGQVQWDGQSAGMPPFVTDNAGSFRVSVTIPVSASVGDHRVTALAAVHTGSALFRVTSAAPVSSTGVYLGVWQPGAPWDMTALARYEQAAGKQAAIVHWYQGWGAANAPLDTRLLSAVAAHGSAPMITWEPWDYTRGLNQPEYSLAAIASGRYDGYVRSWADGLARYGGPVLIRWAHEMNLQNYPWSVGIQGNTAAQYVAAWRRLRDIFTAAGARNVQWVWSPNVAWNTETAFEPMYPGDAYVDWVGLDGYNFIEWGGWQSFGQIFGNSYTAITRLSTKPVMIAEVASAEQGGSKAGWIADMFSHQLPSAYPRIRAVVWFNDSKEADWRLTSTETARAAFAAAVAAPVYRSTWQ